MKTTSFLVFSVFLLINSSYSSIIYVPSDQPTIQAGINVAEKSDTVLVAENTYFENINFNGKAITVASHYLVNKDSSHIFNTIINGSQPSHQDSGSVVFMVSGEDTNSVVCGFTMEYGTGTDITNSIGFPARVGGAILTFSGGTITNNVLRNNRISNFLIGAGGAIFSGLDGSGFIILEGNSIYDNVLNVEEQAVGGGIALYNIDGRIQNNIISRNQSSIFGTITTRIVGGGIFCESSSESANTVKITSNNVSNNSIKSGTDLMESHGGGMASWFTRVIVKNNTINFNSIDNTCSSFGAGISLSYCGEGTEIKQNKIRGNRISSRSIGYGAISISSSNSIKISENYFYNNRMRNGGGLFAFTSKDLEVSSNYIRQNIASNNGGGIYIIDSNTNLTNNIITNNSAHIGGGISFYSANKELFTKPKESKKTFCTQPSNHYTNKISATKSVITNNTVVENSARGYGGGIYTDSDSLIILNSIVWENRSAINEQIFSTNANVLLAYCDIQDTLWSGIGNINADPFFSDDTYNLEDESLCIRAGTDSVELYGKWYYSPLIDFDGDQRPMPVGSQTDIGAQEHQIKKISIVNSIDTRSPYKYTLLQNYPNPFNPETNIEFSLPNSEFVTLKIYNLLGQEVANIVSGKLTKGNYKYTWIASHLASGVYLYQLKAGNFIKTKKLIVLE